MKFRINDLKAILGNWHEFESILKSIKDKSSPELTRELLNTGLQTYDTNVKQLNASMQILGMTIGNELLPGLKLMTIGIKDNVEWLNKNRETVSQVVKYMGLFTEALILYRVQQVLATTSLYKFVTTSMAMTGTATGFVGAIRNMGASILGFGMSIGGALGKMAMFLALAEGINRVMGGYSQDSAEKDFDQTISGYGSGDIGAGNRLSAEDAKIIELKQQRDQYVKDKAMVNAFGGVLFKNGDDKFGFDKLNNEVGNLLQASGAKKGFDNINAMVAIEAEKLKDKTSTNPYGSTAGHDLGGGGKGGEGSGSPTDHTQQEKRIQLQLEYKKILAEIDITEKEHQSTLNNVSTQEAIYGNTIEVVNAKQKENKRYYDQLIESYYSLEEQKDTYIELLDKELEKTDELREKTQSALPNWENLTKAQRREQARLNTELFQAVETVAKLDDLIIKLDTKQADLANNANKISNETTKENLGKTGDKLYQSDRKLNKIKDQESVDIANSTDKLDPFNSIKLNEIRLESLRQQQLAHNAKIAEYDRQLGLLKKGENEKQRQELEDSKRKEEVVYSQNAQKIKEIEYEKNSKIKEGLAGITQEILVQGSSLKSIWNNLWNGLANDAIKALFRIQNTTPSLLGSLLGLVSGGGVNLTGTAPSGVQGPVGSNGGFFKKPHTGGVMGVTSIPSFHNGGTNVSSVFPDETVALLRKNEEVNTMGDRRSIEYMSNNMNAMMEFMQNFMDNQGNQNNSQPIIINAVDSQSFVELMSKHGEAMTTILRSQGALNNGNFR